MVGPIPLSTVIMLAVFLVGGVFLTRTPAGRSIVAIGGNAEADGSRASTCAST